MTTAVLMAPKALTAAFNGQFSPAGRPRSQRHAIPDWDRVKERKTPTA